MENEELSSMHRLNEVLEELQIKKSDLADKLGVSRVTMTNICGYKVAPSLKTIYAIAEILNLSVFQILKSNKPMVGRDTLKTANAVKHLEEALKLLK